MSMFSSLSHNIIMINHTKFDIDLHSSVYSGCVLLKPEFTNKGNPL